MEQNCLFFTWVYLTIVLTFRISFAAYGKGLARYKWSCFDTNVTYRQIHPVFWLARILENERKEDFLQLIPLKVKSIIGNELRGEKNDTFNMCYIKRTSNTY